MIRRLFPVAAVLTALLTSVLIAPGLATAPAEAASHPKPQLTRWTPKLVIPAGKKGKAWRSPWVTTPQRSTALLPSWNVSRMPDGTWLKVYVRVADGSKVSSWKTVAQWRHGLSGGKRTTYGKQADALAQLDTDIVRARSGKSFTRWQIQVSAWRKSTKVKSPVVRAVTGVSSTYVSKTAKTSKTSMTRTIDLKVPASSQMIHRGHFPQFGGGGEAWCSPTSTSMVLRYWGLGPSKKATSFAKGADPWVDHAARYSYDSSYRGTGTWPFNTAYASRFGTDAVVHRLVNLRPIESYIKQGVPVIASVAFGRGQLTGSPISSTPGHLMVVRGFTATGDVIVNDPAGRTNSQVRRVYDRAQFERAWLKGSGGVTYVIAPTAKRLKF
ncbi:peptidase C39 family protein [Aeromicrobium duanguangcaii]|uniref:Peptidase C39 family protein n=1 Tax=Aeromicrobium duanguangcaii TaxID=2968086 RepID=A0ABY5KE52_9ACTN|nr:peptidase C39 family protein [Aeromicrobium duanguangcaii]MCD9155189.1 peptidase C39 family protein [Aeromicrobium duanguangcaii]UUI68160.1 peptidase C39 family protein [Aeromicrobium duanguangcaii]